MPAILIPISAPSEMHTQSTLTSTSRQADLCVPRLNEGDQVVLINGRDISDYTHDDVVMLIKASCENQSGELILLVRPNGEELIIALEFTILIGQKAVISII